jgi:hypothetical protein
LYDSLGNPAALASGSHIMGLSRAHCLPANANLTFVFAGWLVNICADASRLHRYAVLTPTFLACFNSEDHAAINEDGFMTGECGAAALDPYSTIGYQLNLYAVGKSTIDGSLLTLRMAGDAADESNPMLSRATDGSLCLLLECSNATIAEGWLGAVQTQAPLACAISPPPRTRPARAEAVPVGSSLPVKAAPAPSLKRQDSLLARLGGLLLTGSASAVGGSTPTLDDDYVVYEPWAARGVDLMSKSNRKHLEDAAGHPAAIMHGWLTKRNKSGITSGKVDKDRYFVLTPNALAFFTDDSAASVSAEGYMLGKCGGERTGFLGRTGGALSLEAICEVRLMALSAGGDASSSLNGLGRGSAASDATDVDVSPAGDSSRSRSKPSKSARVSGDNDSGYREGLAKPAPPTDEYDAAASSSNTQGASVLSTLFSIDFGDYALVCNAHNEQCRVAWVHALRRWSAWRKRALDQEMLASFGK